ncbi:MAG TPA: hypothetical protein VG603_08345 [Chitinophagales bacterium]|nr:hypothetical protein [Chitinophagales bacterium]
MTERPYIKLDDRGNMPTLIFVDQISSIISLGILGTKIILKEIRDGKNVEHVFPTNFDEIEEELMRLDPPSLYKRS